MERGTPKLTASQKLAVDARGKSVCVVAGAGTGKTSVLVERYIGLLSKGDAEVPQIIAITFTEKAAKEMKDRIRKACRDKIRQAPDAEGRRFWLRQRNELDGAQISTIHSLCARLIRECPVEAGVDPRFSVLDEAEGDILLGKAVKKALADLLDDEDEDALRLVAEYELSKTMDLILAMLKQRGLLDMCLQGWDFAGEAETLQRWTAALRRAMGSADAVAVIRETRPLNPGDKMDTQRTEVVRIVDRLERSKEPDVALLRALYEQCNCQGGSKAKWAEGDLERLKDAFKSLRELLQPANTKEPGEAERKAIGAAAALVRASRRVIETYAQHKRESGCLDFQDLELIARDLLTKNAAVQERYRSRVLHVLVDEFQDTNELQKEIINAITGGEKTSKLFVVGDAKQSIYRFRGADVSVFVKTARAVEAAQGESVSLDRNFRSLPALVAFANCFFGELMPKKGPAAAPADYEAVYENLEHTRASRPDHAQVELLLASPTEGDNAATLRHREADLIARRIQLMVEDGETLVHWSGQGKEERRAVRHGDIAVLFRAMSDVWIYEQALRERSIPYYVVAGSGFYARQEAKDVLNLLRVLDNRTDDVSLAGLLRSPMFAVSDNALYRLGAERETSLYERLIQHASIPAMQAGEREKLEHAAAVLQELLEMRDRVSLPRLLTCALEKTGYDAALLSQFLGRQKALNIYKLVEMARKFDRRGLFTLHDFADYIGEFVASEVREGEAPVTQEASDVVRVMTIHKAKGLEFPVVFVADISREENVRGRDVFLHKEWGVVLKTRSETGEGEETVPLNIVSDEEKRKEEAESKRILYVAATRAQDYLVFSGWPYNPSEKNSKGKWFSWLDKTFNIAKADSEVAYKGGRIRITRNLPDAKGATRGLHKSWAQRHPEEIDSLRPLPEDGGRSGTSQPPCGETLDRQVSRIEQSLAGMRGFTASGLQEYRRCPMAYKLRNVLGLPASPDGSANRESSGRERPANITGAALARLQGKAAHRALQLLAGGRECSPENVLAEALSEAAFEEARAVEGRESQSRVLRHIADAMARFRKSDVFAEIQESRRVLTEFPFLVCFQDGFYLEGSIDLLYEGAKGWEILDYKPRREADIGSFEVQLQAYCLAVEKIFGKPAGAGIFFVNSGERRREAVTPEYLRRAQADLFALAQGIRDSRFPADPRGGCPCRYAWTCAGRTQEALTR